MAVPPKKGLFGSFVLVREPVIIKQVLRTGILVLFGGVLFYTTWELLIFFMSCLGPTDSGVWTHLGSVWDVFE